MKPNTPCPNEVFQGIHPLINPQVSAIINDLERRRDISGIMSAFQLLTTQVESYQREINKCRVANDCSHEPTLDQAMERLGIIRTILRKYRHTLPVEVAINEIRDWAKSPNLNQDLRCIECIQRRKSLMLQAV